MTIPGTAKGIIEALIHEHNFSIITIAQKVCITPKAIYEILRDTKPLPETDTRLICLYIRAKLMSMKKKTNKFLLNNRQNCKSEIYKSRLQRYSNNKFIREASL